ncbi:RNA-metabolising metallo-beta-lactamase [groundwater metagenome]
MSSPITIQFCGAACEVTGSMHLLTIEDKKILLDAGAFQGTDAKDKNSAPLVFDPVEIDYIFLTHAHYDHTGRLPMLCQRGFKGEIITTPATREITFRIMDDSLRIQKEEGEELLFTEEDVKKAKSLFVPLNEDYPRWQDDEKMIKIKFIPSEHILGSSSIFIEEPVSLLYTGDIGGGSSSLHSIPKPSDTCDYLIIESTYGNRILEKSHIEILSQLKAAVESIRKNNSRLLIPIFSVDRAEEILFMLRELNIKEKIYLDTPMGIDMLDIYSHNKYLLSKISDEFLKRNSKELDKIFHPDNFERLRARKNSDELAESTESCIILASSGMLEGGRIRKYLPRFLPDEKNILLFSGFQAEGTLGRDIINGNSEVNVDGIPVKVKAGIKKLEGLSAHADKTALLNYIDCFKILPVKVFIVHGERGASLELSDAIKDKFRIKTFVPKMNEEYDLAAGEVRERTIVKGISTGTICLNFENISGKKMALFAGGIIDNGDGYSLVSVREIEEMLHDLKKEMVKPLHDEIIIPETHIQPETLSSATPPLPEELVMGLIKIFKEGYISKSLIRDLIDASERGISEYRKIIDKKIKNDALILDENDLSRKGIQIPDRSLISGQLEDLLKRSSLMEPANLQLSLNRMFNEIK